MIDKLVEFGRRAMFVIRVMSGYEERRIRSYRLLMQKRMDQAQEKKAALKKVPEQIILAEVRRMVEEMQTLNRQLEETEKAIDEYFKPIDKNVETIMNMQLDKEEKNMKEMVKAMQQDALLKKVVMERIAKADANQSQTAEELKTSSRQSEDAK